VSQLGDYAWYHENAWNVGEKYPHLVGQKKPNPWGLYDMHGNVNEWCQDCYAASRSGDVFLDPTGPVSTGWRLIRGGNIESQREDGRSASRVSGQTAFRNDGLGFRVLRSSAK